MVPAATTEVDIRLAATLTVQEPCTTPVPRTLRTATATRIGRRRTTATDTRTATMATGTPGSQAGIKGIRPPGPIRAAGAITRIDHTATADIPATAGIRDGAAGIAATDTYRTILKCLL